MLGSSSEPIVELNRAWHGTQPTDFANGFVVDGIETPRETLPEAASACLTRSKAITVYSCARSRGEALTPNLRGEELQLFPF